MQSRFGSMTATAITTSKNKMPTRTAIMTSTMRTAAATGRQRRHCQCKPPLAATLPPPHYRACPVGLAVTSVVLILLLLHYYYTIILLLYHYYYILLLLLLLCGYYICSYCIALRPRQKSVKTRKRTLEPWACRDEAMGLRKVT